LPRAVKHTYQIDQVVFYTGGNDVFYSYLNELRTVVWEGRSRYSPANVGRYAATWQLVETALRIRAKLFPPWTGMLVQLDRDILPRLRNANPFRHNISAADEYCREAGIRCDFVLQPLLVSRRALVGREAEMKNTLLRMYPRLDVAAAQTYSDAIASGPPNRVHDFSIIFDEVTGHYFFDVIHLNEAGNRLIAERLASAVSFAPQ
jgi:lysophospholipase L1-like esterase